MDEASAGARERTIFTIGHSTRSFEDFLNLLQKNGVKLLADVRRFPGSTRYPHFSKQPLEKLLAEAGKGYIHYEALGGRRQAKKNSLNTAWKNDAFRGYADYIETEEFINAIRVLEAEASKETVAIMCSEAVWWRCHRSLISDYLKAQGWEVLHIIDDKEPKEHPYTAAASITEGKLSYGKGLFEN